MSPPDGPAAPPAPALCGERLVLAYALCTALYLGAMWAVTAAGFQPTPDHFTPFYARLDPLFATPAEAPAALALMWFAYLLVRWALAPGARFGAGRAAVTALAAGAVLSVFIAAWRSDVEGQASRFVIAGAITLRLLLRHLPPIALGAALAAGTHWFLRKDDGAECAPHSTTAFLIALIAFAFVF
ncbi:MAG: hypothetical protein JXR94_19315, partial [Candidatus Hydrogenedentes bacterium]|nr:hypothetical protein [Candidatus Hydrogenedentota bacterium]